MVLWLTWCHYQQFGHRLCGVGMADHALCVRLLSANCGGMLTCDVSSQLNALSVSGYPGLHAECLGSLATRHHTWSVSLYLYSWVLPPFIHRHISCSVPWNEPPFTDESSHCWDGWTLGCHSVHNSRSILSCPCGATWTWGCCPADLGQFLAKSYDFDWSKPSYLDSYWPAVMSGRHVRSMRGQCSKEAYLYFKGHS